MLPPVSDPIAAKATPAATATPEPEEETPVQCFALPGLGEEQHLDDEHEGALGQLGFTKQYCTRVTQAIYHRRRIGWTKIFHHQGPGCGGHPLGYKAGP